MHNSFIEPNQLQTSLIVKYLKKPFTGLLAVTSCVIQDQSPTHQLLLSVLFWLPWLLGPWNFFNDQARYWIPACITIGVSISRTVSNVDTNTDFSLVNVVTVAFYCSRFVGHLATACHVPSDVNRQWTAALSAIEGDEPSLTTIVAEQVNVALINNTESGVIFPLVKNTILQNTKTGTLAIWYQNRHWEM